MKLGSRIRKVVRGVQAFAVKHSTKKAAATLGRNVRREAQRYARQKVANNLVSRMFGK